MKKNRLKFWKNRTEPNPNRKKPSQTWKKPSQNQAKLVWTGFCPKNRTKTGRFKPLSVWFFLISVWLLFFDKNWTKSKIITSIVYLILKLKYIRIVMICPWWVNSSKLTQISSEKHNLNFKKIKMIFFKKILNINMFDQSILWNTLKQNIKILKDEIKKNNWWKRKKKMGNFFFLLD